MTSTIKTPRLTRRNWPRPASVMSDTVLAREGDETFEADPETERMLLTAIAQCDGGEAIPMAQLLGELRDRE